MELGSSNHIERSGAPFDETSSSSAAISKGRITRHIVIVFGRPGSGKTSVAEEAMALMRVYSTRETDSKLQVDKYQSLHLDLDVCIPQWMKDNFSRGIYPSDKERMQFALSACDYVEAQIAGANAMNNEKHKTANKVADCFNNECSQLCHVLLSFSFVNDDIRDVFRSRFPWAQWILIDTTEKEADRRIGERKGHFYNGSNRGALLVEGEEGESNSRFLADVDRAAEWKFATVKFDHIRLDGNEDLFSNAKKVVDEIMRFDRR